MPTITKDDVQAYEDVRQSGVTNMFDVTRVSQLSGLDRDRIMAIMKDYGNLVKKFNIKRSESYKESLSRMSEKRYKEGANVRSALNNVRDLQANLDSLAREWSDVGRRSTMVRWSRSLDKLAQNLKDFERRD